MAISHPELWTLPKAGEPGSAENPMEELQYVQLQQARDSVFKKIKPMVSWKLPISAVIAAADFDDCNQAAIWFTGGELTVEGTFEDGRLWVSGAGYYANIGA